jgi:hypothetical protein
MKHSWNSEPQNIEQEISNDEVWSRCAQSFFKNNNDRIPYFDIRYSLFDAYSPPEEDSLFAFSEFLFRFDRPFFWPAAALNPEPLNPGTPAMDEIDFLETYNKIVCKREGLEN